MKFFILRGVESGFILHLIVHSGTGTDTEIDKESYWSHIWIKVAICMLKVGTQVLNYSTTYTGKRQ